MSTTRTETDSFDRSRFPPTPIGRADRRSIENFPFGPREQMPLEIATPSLHQAAAARVNARIGGLDPQIAESIQQLPRRWLAAIWMVSFRWLSGRPVPALSRT